MRTWRVVVLLLVALAACGDQTDVTEGDLGEDGPAAEFAAPEDGATVSSPVQVEMQAVGFEVEEAGEVNEGAGHFHIAIDAECAAEGETVPDDDSHQHFGDGSTSAELELEPGEHSLCLQPADGAHTAFGATDEITITVE